MPANESSFPARQRSSIIEEPCPVTGRWPNLSSFVPDEFTESELATREAKRLVHRNSCPDVPLPPCLMRTPFEARRHVATQPHATVLKRKAPGAATSATQPSAAGAGPGAAESLERRISVAHRNAADADWGKARKLLQQLAQTPMTAAETGVRNYSILRAVPSLLTEYSSGYCSPCVEGSRGSSRISADLLPLPMPEPSALSNWSRRPDVDASDPSFISWGAECWLALVVAGINAMGGHFFIGAPHGPCTDAQSKALALLRKDCLHFVSDTSARTPTDVRQHLGAKADSYLGQAVYTAMDVTLLQVRPTLPAVGVAASCDICEIVEGQLRDQLRDPESLLRPQSEWPPTLPRAKTMLADQKEWLPLANLMWERDLCLWLPKALIFAPYGEPMVSWLFEV